MARLDKEKQKELEPDRIKTALRELTRLNKQIIAVDNTRIGFMHNQQVVTFYPYSGWHTGKSITDGRGLKKLLKQLK